MKHKLTSRVATFKRWSRASYGAFASLGRTVRIGVLSTSMGIIAFDAMAIEADSTKFRTPEADSMRYGDDIETVTVLGDVGRSSWSLRPDGVTVKRMPTLYYAPNVSVEDALRKSPSIDVRQRGARGTQADISVRGSSADQTMIMLNGVSFSDARTGHQSHSLPISMANVDQLTLSSHQTKMGAYSGALDYRTLGGSKNFLDAYTNGGAYGTYSVGASGAYNIKGGLMLYGSAGYDHSDGYINNTDYNRVNIYFRGVYKSQKYDEIDFQLGYQDMNFGANGFYSLAFPMQWEATRTALGSVRYSKSWSGWKLEALASYRLNTDRFELYRPYYTTPPPSYNGGNYHLTNNVGLEAKATRDWGEAGRTSIGAEFTYNHIVSTVLGEKMSAAQTINGIDYNYGKERAQASYFVRHAIDLNIVNISASVALAQTPYGLEPLGSVVAVFKPTDGLNLEVGASRTMRLPTFTDLYYTTPTHVGNKDLVPEKAVLTNFGASYYYRHFSISANVYYRWGSDIIDWVQLPGDAKWRSMQLTKLGTFGVELQAGYSPTRGFIQSINLSYGYINSDKSSGDYISKYALDYMKHKASLGAQLRLHRNLILALTGTHYERNGDYIDASGVKSSFEPYFLLDARLTWNIKKLSIWGECTNIFDQHYFDFGGLIQPGRWLMAGIRVKII